MTDDKFRIHANEEGLKAAKQVAEKLGIPYDENQIIEDTPRLVEYYYLDICRVLTPHVKDIRFDQYVHVTQFPNTRAFYTPYKDQEIFFDQILELSIGNLFFQLLTLTYGSISSKQKNQIIELTKSTLGSFGQLEELRKVFDELYQQRIEPADILHFHHSMTITVIVFMLCHEIAHHYLQHLDEAIDPKQEFEADRLGFKWLCLISKHYDQLHYAKVGENTLCAPIIYQKLFGLGEKLGFYSIDTNTHPPMADRAKRLEERLISLDNPNALLSYKHIKLPLTEFESAIDF